MSMLISSGNLYQWWVVSVAIDTLAKEERTKLQNFTLATSNHNKIREK